jgi:hypothetical protein
MSDGINKFTTERLQETISELESELSAYRAFFEASLAMNKMAAQSKDALAVHAALQDILVLRARKGIKDD